jgi:pimeloyl-ACP methyl ester carboxylesterase
MANTKSAEGRGRAFAFVHGLPGSHGVWSGVLRHAPTDARVELIGLDVSGEGAAPTLAALEEGLRSALAALDGDELVLVGHSFGAKALGETPLDEAALHTNHHGSAVR